MTPEESSRYLHSRRFDEKGIFPKYSSPVRLSPDEINSFYLQIVNDTEEIENYGRWIKVSHDNTCTLTLR
jgi:hypothetical protein